MTWFQLRGNRIFEADRCRTCDGTGAIDDQRCSRCVGGLLGLDRTCRNEECQRLIATGVEPEPGCIWCEGSGVQGHGGSWRNLNWSEKPGWSRHPRRLPSVDHDGDRYHLELVQLSLRLEKEGRRAEALSALKQAAKRATEGEGAWAWFRIGQMRFADRAFAEAAAAFDRSYGIARDPVAAEWAQAAMRESERARKRHWWQ